MLAVYLVIQIKKPYPPKKCDHLETSRQINYLGCYVNIQMEITVSVFPAFFLSKSFTYRRERKGVIRCKLYLKRIPCHGSDCNCGAH